MARRTKAEIQLEKRIDAACQNACSGLSINIMKLSQISKAAKEAAAVGGDIEGAARSKAVELHNQDNPGDQR